MTHLKPIKASVFNKPKKGSCSSVYRIPENASTSGLFSQTNPSGHFNHPFPVLETPAVSDLGDTLPEALENIHTLLSFGVTMHFTEDNLSSTDPKFAELLRMLDMIAEDASKRMTERILAAREERSKDGVPVSVSAYGYKKVNGEWKVDELAARRVKTAFYLASQCICYMEIRKKLDKMEKEEGTGVAWNQVKLRYLLLNERYKGDILTNKHTNIVEGGRKKEVKNHGKCRQYYLEGHHEPLVGAETFDLVQEAVLEGWLKSNKTTPENGIVEKMMRTGAADPLLKCAHLQT